MTSSKSLRADTLPSSISLSPPPKQQLPPTPTESESPTKLPHRRKPSFDFFPKRTRGSPRRTSHAVKPGIEYDLPNKPLPLPPSPPRNITNTKPRKWGDRLSSLLPVLTSSSATDSSSANVQRKPVSLSVSGKVSPTETPPPPYKEYDSKHSPPIDPLDTPAATDSDRGSSPPFLSGSEFLLSSDHTSSSDQTALPHAATMPILRTEIPHSALGIDEQPQIASVTGSIARSGSETQLSPMHELPPQTPASRNGSTDEGNGDLRGPRKLRKSSVSPKRPRANSYQPGPSIPVPGITASSTMPLAELRGRSVSSHPTLSVTEISAPPSMPPPPIPRPSSRGVSPKSASQSPNRNRIRKSWMPGGRSRSNSVEVSSPIAKMQAWIMTEESTSEYNPSFLKNAEKVNSLHLPIMYVDANIHLTRSPSYGMRTAMCSSTSTPEAVAVALASKCLNLQSAPHIYSTSCWPLNLHQRLDTVQEVLVAEIACLLTMLVAFTRRRLVKLMTILVNSSYICRWRDLRPQHIWWRLAKAVTMSLIV